MFDFSDALGALSGDEFEETPVTPEVFVSSPEYLGLPPMSKHQYQMIRAMSQIYKRETLVNLYGPVDGNKRFHETYNEVIFQLGKGSGKDYTSTVACAYIVHLLLCLKDPAVYFGKPPGDAIDIINIAINAKQASNVFFKGFKQRIERSPWFQGKYTSTAEAIKFDKEVTVHSGHSEREAWEGYNVILVILDEISGFALENTTGHAQSKTAEEVYKMYKASISSRFPDFGKLALLSFPRFKNDFIQQRYNAVIGEVETVKRSETLVVNVDLPHDLAENQLTVEWDEDHIINYVEPKVFALKRPTWDVNPLRKIEDFVSDFYRDYVDALSRFACMPPDSIDGFFKDRGKIEKAFSNPRIAVSEMGQFEEWFQPIPDTKYYLHVDLAQKVDRCVVALAHIDDWVMVTIGKDYQRYQPKVIVDAIRYWTPSSTKTVDFAEVREYILDLSRKGFDLGLVTFDRWNSLEMMQQLETYSIKTDTLSVAKQHYTDLAMVIGEERLNGPLNDIIVTELLQLRIIRDKIDHPRSGSKDLADAVCGAVYNAIKYTPKRINGEIEVHVYEAGKSDNPIPQKQKPARSTQPIPDALKDWLDGMTTI